MSFLNRLFDSKRERQAQEITQQLSNYLRVNPLCSEYSNLFAQLRPLIEAMKIVIPYGVNARGDRLRIKSTPELEVLMNPNIDMGWSEFSDAMFATWLTKSELNIRVHFKDKKIIGYTLLNGSTKIETGDDYYFQTPSGEKVPSDEVITLTYSRNPDNLAEGISPAQSVRVWSQIDDLLAQFQRAYFQNGAVPAFITTISASTPEKFNEVRQNLERSLKGSNNAHKTIYLWEQFQPTTGESKKQVEITPIQGNNSTMAIKELADIINDRLNKSVGVSNFILGDDSSAKYDNAELSDRQFTKRRVYPALSSFWGQFEHELNRIVGGLRYRIEFDLEIPELTERKHANALINKENANTLSELINAGADPISACDAMGLNHNWKLVAQGIKQQHEQELEFQHEQAQQAQLPALTDDKEEVELLPALDSDKLIPNHHHHHNDAYVPFTDEEEVERKIFEQLVGLANAIFDENPNIDSRGVINEIVKLLTDEADKGALEAVNIINNMLDDEDILGTIEKIKEEREHLISDQFADRLAKRTEALVDGYEKKTREIMRAVLQTSQGYTAEEIRERLASRIPDGKASTIARNETVYAFKSGRLEMDKSLANQYDLQIELTWHTSKDGDVCPLCREMEGKKVLLGKSFEPIPVKDGDTVLSWSKNSWNDFGEIPNAHTNCRCYFDEKLIRRNNEQ